MLDFDDTAFDLTAMSALKADGKEDIADGSLDDILNELSLGPINDDWTVELEDTVSAGGSIVSRIRRQRQIIEQQTTLVPPSV